MICNCCKIDKNINEYQTYWHSTQQKYRTRKECTKCYNHKKNEKKKLRLNPNYIIKPVMNEKEKLSYLLTTFDNNDYLQNPNSYINETQQELIHLMMTHIFNWKWNEDTKIWSKEGVKDKNNNWSIIKKSTKNTGHKRYFTEERKRDLVSQMVELKKLGKRNREICKLVGLGETTVCRWLKEYEEGKKY